MKNEVIYLPSIDHVLSEYIYIYTYIYIYIYHVDACIPKHALPYKQKHTHMHRNTYPHTLPKWCKWKSLPIVIQLRCIPWKNVKSEYTSTYIVSYHMYQNAQNNQENVSNFHGVRCVWMNTCHNQVVPIWQKSPVQI